MLFGVCDWLDGIYINIYIYIYIYRYRLARAAIDRGEGDAGEGPVRKTTRPACAVLYSKPNTIDVNSATSHQLMINLPRQARDKSLLTRLARES
eukprot:COSAG06_NODE_414_length_16033_cov_67.366717_2_plen_94_part_00